ncbi:triple tyrosine motif-containing protein [Dyella sp. A6]|uniref:sensor histidine kinase n=1 Tax=Dyella aluminiiresistens TaxID=3069105 RepID=UPI002E7A08BF|nr:triple tyrosine motif-containing protein [Dyella sp. A6]
MPGPSKRWEHFSRTMFCVAALLVMATGNCLAARVWSLNRYQHTAWTGRDGAPTGLTNLVQTTDGFIWIGADKGMFRFDGLSFERIRQLDGVDLSDGPVKPFFAGRDGSLWVVADKGGLIEFRHGKATRYTSKQGVPGSGYIKEITAGPKGQVWMVAQYAIYRLVNGRWVVAAPDLLQQHISVISLLVDQRGGVWAGTAAALYYRAPGAARFVLLEKKGYVLFMAERHDGSVWVRYLKHTIERWNFRDGVPVLATGVIRTSSDGYMVFDHQGDLWINGLGDGIEYVPASAIDADPELAHVNSHIASFDTSDGLSGDYVWPSMVDREGNIWFGTESGIDRFTRSDFAMSAFPASGHYFSLAPGLHGSIWAGSTGEPVMETDAGQLKTTRVPVQMMASTTGPDGVVYMAGPGGLWQMDDHGVRQLYTFTMAHYPSVLSLARDADGVLWFGVAAGHHSGLYSLQDGKLGIRKDISEKPPEVIFADSRGRLWMGYMAHGDILVYDHGRKTYVGGRGALNVGESPAFTEARGRVWIGGGEGLGYMDGMTLKRLQFPPGKQIRNVTGLVFANDGDLWVHALDGVYRIPGKEIDQVLAGRRRVTSYQAFDALDGVPGAPAPHIGHPTVVKGSDGRLWFSTSDGVAWVDPSQRVADTVAPPVLITRVEADDKVFPAGTEIKIPPLPRTLRIHFAVPSFSAPGHIQVRVRLQGLDPKWHSVGRQREVAYTNLAPGHYTFEVIACNGEGVWNRTGAHLAITVMPAYYQTYWFAALCVALALTGIWMLFMLRLREMNRRTLMLAEAQRAERERIARDLHDTLLQNFPASLMKLEAEVKGLPGDIPRDGLERAVDHAYDIVTQGRNQVARLRAAEGGSLTDTLSDVLAAWSRDYGIAIDVTVDGAVRSLLPLVHEQVIYIVREAVLNACRHAAATSIRVVVAFRRWKLVVSVVDDGVGMPADLLRGGTRAGHWGLQGMRERAQQLSARLRIGLGANGGTVIRLTVPARLAYRCDDDRAA